MKVLSSQNISDIKKKVPTVLFDYPTTTAQKNETMSASWAKTMFDSNFLRLGTESKGVGYSYHVAIGANTTVRSNRSVALGYGAVTTRNGEVNIGTDNATNSGYDNTNTRILGGVHDGVLNTDACTVGQLKTSIADYVPNTRTINGKALNTDISLTASDVGALPTTGGTMTGGITLPKYTTAAPQASVSRTLRFVSDQITSGVTPVLMIGQSHNTSEGAQIGIGLGTTGSQTATDWRCILRGIGTPIHAYDACPKDWVDTHTYAICRSEANVPVKVVEVPNLVVKAGVVLNVYFTKGSDDVSTPKLSVNGAEALIVNGAYNSMRAIAEREIVQFVYDGSYWSIVSGQPRELYATLSIKKGGTGSTSASGALKNLGGVSSAASVIVASPVVGYYKHGGSVISLSAGEKNKVCQLTLRALGAPRFFSSIMVFGVSATNSASADNTLYLGIENASSTSYTSLGSITTSSNAYFYKTFDVSRLANANVPVGIYVDNPGSLNISRLSVVALGCLDSSYSWSA